METPICDFVRQYAESRTLRAHMPGHKGTGPLGCEHLDLTEISGADSLYEADGIIRQSEENASRLFGCPTFYSTEGSSQCIRAMLYLAVLDAQRQGRAPKIAAARNVHKTFLSGAALLDLDVVWLYPKESAGYLSGTVDLPHLEAVLKTEHPTAVYLTSPDYLGNVADIAAMAEICHRHGALFLVDNAHGAYLRFLEPARHPMDLGADLCCDSAHKTLPVLTGGAYLHLSAGMEQRLGAYAKHALALFGSTSPSYLILQSLDGANAYLEGHSRRLRDFIPHVKMLKKQLLEAGYDLYGAEPLKITLAPKSRGYTGCHLAQILRQDQVECEFSDPDYLVLMVTPETGTDALRRLSALLCGIPRQEPLTEKPPAVCTGRPMRSIREAMLSLPERIPAEASHGRILAAPSVGCPPAVPILMCGEKITPQAIAAFAYYGITEIDVL